MSALVIPNDIANGQSGDATKVQANFDAIETFVNGSCVHTDNAVPARYGVKVSNTNQGYSGSGHQADYSFAIEDSDPQGFHDPAAPTKVTIPVGGAGIYIVTLTSVNADGTPVPMGFRIRKNGADLADHFPDGTNLTSRHTFTWTGDLAVADYLTANPYFYGTAAVHPYSWTLTVYRISQ